MAKEAHEKTCEKTHSLIFILLALQEVIEKPTGHRVHTYVENLHRDNPDEKEEHEWVEPDREIPVKVADASTEADKYLLAVRLNSRHGLAFTSDDRQHSAVSLYNLGWTVETISRELSVKTATASGWLSRTIKEKRDKQNRKIKAMWLACYTDKEIGDAVGLNERAIAKKIKVTELSFPGKESSVTSSEEVELEEESNGDAVGGGLKPSKSDIASNFGGVLSEPV